jgi:hypothetical protein
MSPLDLVAAIGAEPFTIIGSILAIALGLTGAVVAIIKIPADKSTASMVQAQGANEALAEALAAVERERDYWRDRYETCARRNRELAQTHDPRGQLPDPNY